MDGQSCWGTDLDKFGGQTESGALLAALVDRPEFAPVINRPYLGKSETQERKMLMLYRPISSSISKKSRTLDPRLMVTSRDSNGGSISAS